MRDLLPAVVAVSVAGPADWSGELLPAERAALGERAVLHRRRDFTAGRVCARRALATLGLTGTPVPAGADRAPVWPPGVVGAITHTRDYCAAAAARAADVRAVGIDAERHRPLSPGVRRKVCRPDEEADLARLPAGMPWPTVLFSAKETVYKVWHPLVGTWLGFADARVTLDPQAGTFHAEIEPARLAAAPVADPPSRVTGRFAVDDDLVRTAAVLPHR
ncbi:MULTISPECIES: 4'-phosphopantetheinyl transferase family protein [Micromonospora]|uniref:4'-phosphopantetheinyl transferase family protein n=1 Tax=Micromonospora TaxID=1873 RepID=UPI0003EEC8DE|nr:MULTISPECIES: 4'-phosphopantetheinyl transferase superfamily protein [Micromonospora]EWM66090.1 EntD-related protein [Micromonospora sp. M42]MBC8992456.1 4'-phosphopantetheinyl transferase superfamily protein [Micromonospora chalcea]MBP1780815.1 4'-phosphopantetheinyl transferase EntD [Micromonospora sp. HB375]MBQ1061023.1 4'-phosphopantetheinyl transferase superfamily protein [Micromonospora sp. C41]MBQ1070159.1 4'-phosphopantetheinyl transferase superfamily protein [Micromonospora sp. D75